jgi:2-keto-4-pentenoate hydratase/2-oxohepta-3-ene-1,7-dioic acid hydratase in catechol pathway
MQLARFDDQRLGVVLGDEIADVTAVTEQLPMRSWPFPAGDELIRHLDALRPAIEALLPKAPRLPLAGRKLLSPVANPGKVIAAPVNYRKHIEESRADAGIHFGNEVSAIDRYALFLKATSSVVGAGEGIQVHHDPEATGRRTDHEVELALVIGRETRHISEQDALSCVAGYLIGLDITIRGTEDRSWRKSLDTFTVLGPWLVTADAFGNPESVDLRIAVNGQVKQDANTRDLIWSVRRCIAMASSAYTLHPGDVILTGTPEGVGPIARGDVLDAFIEGIGPMQVAVR